MCADCIHIHVSIKFRRDTIEKLPGNNKFLLRIGLGSKSYHLSSTERRHALTF